MAIGLWPQGSYQNATQLHWHSTVHSSSSAALSNSFYFPYLSLQLSWRKGRRLKVSRMVKCSSELMPLHKISSLVAELGSTKRRRLSQGQWDLLGTNMCVCVCVCVLGGVTEFRSSIIPDWHQLDSEVFTAAMTASASNSWDRRICDVCSLGHQMSCREKSILQLQSPLPVLLRSQQSLRPWKKESGIRGNIWQLDLFL